MGDRGEGAERLVEERLRAAIPPGARAWANVRWLAPTRDGERVIVMAAPGPGAALPMLPAGPGLPSSRSTTTGHRRSGGPRTRLREFVSGIRQAGIWQESADEQSSFGYLAETVHEATAGRVTRAGTTEPDDDDQMIPAVASLPPSVSYSSLSMYAACPLRYAFRYVERVPAPDEPRPPFAFGHAAHEAFEAFTRDRRERLARGEPGPTRDDLERLLRDRWVPADFGDADTERAYQGRVGALLDSFWTSELEAPGEVLAEELEFALVVDPGDGSEPVRVCGVIDRVDRLPSGGIEVIDYKTGRLGGQPDLERNLQLTIYALACRDALGLGTPERLTLWFAESAVRLSTTRTDDQLDAARSDLVERVRPMRAGEFPARAGRQCEWCDYRAMCPERA